MKSNKKPGGPDGPAWLACGGFFRSYEQLGTGRRGFRMNLVIALGHVASVVNVRRAGDKWELQVFSRRETANLGCVRRHSKAQSKAFCRIRPERTASRAQQPDSNAVAVRRWSAGMTIPFAPIL